MLEMAQCCSIDLCSEDQRWACLRYPNLWPAARGWPGGGLDGVRSEDSSPVLCTPRETTLPRLTDLDYWASGLTPVYLDGALTRAIHAARVPHVDTEVPEVSFYDEPAPDPHVTRTEATAVPVTNPIRAPEMAL